MSDILEAARSYYGLADTDVRKTDIYTNESGQPMLVFEIAFTLDDFLGIAERAKNMQQPDTQPDTAIIEGPTVEDMREAYNALSKAEKGRYGSFARYMAESSGGIVTEEPSPAMRAIMQRAIDQAEAANKMDAIDDRQVVHVDAPEEPDSYQAGYVWIDKDEIPGALWAYAVDQRVIGGKFCLAMNPAMLTDEQKQKAKEANP